MVREWTQRTTNGQGSVVLNSARPRHSRAARATIHLTTAACLAAGLGACGGDDPEDRPTVTVTASSTGATSTPAPTTPTAPKGDVDGRAHDVGTITEVIDFEGAVFLKLDRYTYADWDDERVAAEGVPLAPLTDNPFTNQNDDNTYTVPVSKDAVVALNECQTEGQPEPKIATQPGSVSDLTASDTVWLLTYTDGQLTLADTIAPC